LAAIRQVLARVPPFARAAFTGGSRVCVAAPTSRRGRLTAIAALPAQAASGLHEAAVGEFAIMANVLLVYCVVS